MNIERYVWPVIIAASLHGLLVISSIDPVVMFPPPKPIKDGPVETPPPEVIEITPVDVEQGAGESGGNPEPLPQSPDVPSELKKEDFRVDVQETVTPIKAITDLAKIPEKVGMPLGDGSERLRDGLRGVVTPAHLDRVPRATVRPSPNYPPSLRDSSGSVTVEFVVDTNGRVISADAVKWTHREFVDSAVTAVLRWRFEPGTVNGRKVSFRMAIPIEFNSAQ